MPPPTRPGPPKDAESPCVRGAGSQGRAWAPQPLPRHHPRPRAGPGDSACRGGAGLLLCCPGERRPAVGGDPAGDEHLHESHWPHPPGSRGTLTRNARRRPGRHGRRGGASEGAGLELGELGRERQQGRGGLRRLRLRREVSGGDREGERLRGRWRAGRGSLLASRSGGCVCAGSGSDSVTL